MIVRLRSPEFLIWLGLSLLLIWLSWGRLVTLEGWDPDDQLRLVQLRDFLNGQSWFDSTQYRMNMPDGAPMHWSRLIELPLAAVVLLVKPLFGQHVAEMAAGIIVPLGCLGLITFMLSRVAAELGGGRAAGIAGVITAMVSPAIVLQTRPMRIDHHGWQIVCACLAFWTLFWPSARKAGLTIGLALAVWLHISLEGGPSAVIFFALLGWRWAVNGDDGVRLGNAIIAFCAGSLVLFFGTQATGIFAANFCDTISPAHLAAILAATAIMVPATKWLPAKRTARLAIAGVAGLVAIVVLYHFAPQCSKGAFSTMDPIVREYWLERINESQPGWEQDPIVANLFLGIPVVAMLTLMALYSKLPKQNRFELIVLMGYSLVLGMLVFRTISVATAVSAPIVAAGIAALFARYRAEPKLVLRLSYIALMLLMLMPGGFAVQTYLALNPDKAEEAQKETEKSASKTGGDCESVASVRKLRALKNAQFVAPFDIGPTILMMTPHKVLASSHHRNEKAMRDHIDIFRLPPAQAQKIVVRRGITHIVACADEEEMQGYLNRDPDGLWGQLAVGKTPAWLAPQRLDAGKLRVWRVLDDSTQ